MVRPADDDPCPDTVEDVIRGLRDDTIEFLHKGTPPEDILPYLCERGMPRQLAEEMIRLCAEARRAHLFKEAKERANIGGIMLGAGALITGGGYLLAAPGGTYIVTSGLLVWGGGKLLLALMDIAEHRPKGAVQKTP
ncbi:MAG: hypothetical protein FD180_4352 [Planctomycetota bacterium]|nr:MAG: hypothetical protein FD180_4352 [Planctomycetota bacterium]